VSAAYYLRLAFTAAQRSDDDARTPLALPQLGVAVGASLLFTTAATLALGIVPNPVLRAAQTAAHTLQVPGADTTTEGANQPQQPRP
jgi:NADH-quinone oxidoreductase subunit N